MEIENLVKNLGACFSEGEINTLAKDSLFIQRSSSRLDGMSFLLMNVFDTSSGKERSLNDCCDWLAEHFGISMTKQSLDERYNCFSVRFMKSCFMRILSLTNESLLGKDFDLKFKGLRITDSTSYKIPSSLSTFYKGYKGNGGASVLKIHLNYDLLDGQVIDISLGDGCRNDNSYCFGKGEEVEEGALYLRDLGYYDLDFFNAVEKGGGYFLSRCKTNAYFSTLGDNGKYLRLDLKNQLPDKGVCEEIENVYLGSSKKKTKVRLILEKVPKEVALERVEKLSVNANKQKDKSVSEQKKFMCHYNVFITNADSELLTKEQARSIYSLRWQIELVFKIWKSVFKISEVKKMSIFRFECYLYAKLISILLTSSIQNKLGQELWRESEFEISMLKASKLIKKNSLA